MGAVTVVVASGVELVVVGPDDRAVRVEHLACAEQLVVARERLVVHVVGGVAELAGRPLGVVERAELGEGP